MGWARLLILTILFPCPYPSLSILTILFSCLYPSLSVSFPIRINHPRKVTSWGLNPNSDPK